MIDEAVKRIPDWARSPYREMPWRDIAGMQNKLIRDRVNLDVKIIWQALLKEIPDLKMTIARVFEDLRISQPSLLEGMHLTPTGIVELDHRAFYISRASNRFVFVVASGDGKISAIDREFNVKAVGENWGRIRSISVNRTGTRLAVCHENELTIADLNGSVIFAENAPPLELDLTWVWNWPEEGFEDCFFEPENDNLWCVAHISGKKVEIQVREPKNWSIIYKIVINDPLGGSEWSFHLVPSCGNAVALLANAQQHGQEVYWLMADDQLHCTIEPALEDTTPPKFAPNGREFLRRRDDRTIDRCAYPDVRELGTCLWPFDDDDDDGFGDSFFTSIINMP